MILFPGSLEAFRSSFGKKIQDAPQIFLRTRSFLSANIGRILTRESYRGHKYPPTNFCAKHGKARTTGMHTCSGTPASAKPGYLRWPMTVPWEFGLGCPILAFLT